MGNRVTNTSISGNDLYILSGRGRGYEKHGGNKKFHRLVKSHAAEYNDKTTRRKQKSLIIEAVCGQLAKDSMRIVKRINDTTWVEMDEDEARIKIGHALRDTKMDRGKRSCSDQAKDCMKALANHNSAVKTSLLHYPLLPWRDRSNARINGNFNSQRIRDIPLASDPQYESADDVWGIDRFLSGDSDTWFLEPMVTTEVESGLSSRTTDLGTLVACPLVEPPDHSVSCSEADNADFDMSLFSEE